MASNPLDPNELFAHVQDQSYFHVPRWLSPHGDGHIYLPQPLAEVELGPDGKPITDDHGHVAYTAAWRADSDVALINRSIEPLDFKLTKFMVLEVVVALVLCVVFIGLAARMRRGGPPRGRLWNMLEAILVYFRDYVARPMIGGHDADRFVPLVWTVFFFVLGCNLMGMLPWMGSPTGALATTAALALTTFLVVVGSGMLKLGAVGFWKAQVPHMDLPKPMAIFLVPLIFMIEVMGLIIKHLVLAIRLWANMTGGHLVLAVLIAFIAVTASNLILWAGVMPISVLGATAVSLLELLVAFIQAFIFALLTSLFIGLAVHPH